MVALLGFVPQPNLQPNPMIPGYLICSTVISGDRTTFKKAKFGKSLTYYSDNNLSVH